MELKEFLELARLSIILTLTIIKLVILIKNIIVNWRINIMYLNLFKPNKPNVSDKFSSNLYKFIKKHKEISKVYFDTEDCYDGHKIELDWNKTLTPSQIIIGSEVKNGGCSNCIVGRNLVSILQGKKLSELHAMTYRSKYIDITEEFWDKYSQKGRCLFFNHDAWIQGDEYRFEYLGIGDTRRCTWCGKLQEEKTYKKEIEIKIWE